MTTSVEMINDAHKLAVLEKQVSPGNVSEYARFVLSNCLENRGVLERSKQLIWNASEGSVEGLQFFAILSVLTDDKLGWDTAADVLDDELDPSLPYLAYRYWSSSSDSKACGTDWNFLLVQSAKLGHVQSRVILLEKRVSRFGILRYPLSIVGRCLIALLAIPIVIRDRNDSRLPKST